MGLLLRKRLVMLFRLHTDRGMVVNRLLPMLRVFRASSRLMETGKSASRFVCRNRVVSRVKAPISVGTYWIRLLLRSSTSKLGHWNMLGKAVSDRELATRLVELPVQRSLVPRRVVDIVERIV